MVDSKALIIELDRIPEEGLALSADDSDPTFAAILRDVAESDNAKVTGRAEVQLELWPSRVDVRGRLEAQAQLTCVRCLNRFGHELERDIYQVLLRQPEEHEDEDVELKRSDLDRTELEGDRIDLGELLREEFLLAMPMKALCSEECKGICSGCGAELNTEDCNCKPEADPRWAALAGLKAEEV